MIRISFGIYLEQIFNCGNLLYSVISLCRQPKLKVWWHAATLFFIYFYINRVDIQCLYILLVEYGTLLLSSWLPLGRWSPLGCRALQQVDALLRTLWATPHPKEPKLSNTHCLNHKTSRDLYCIAQVYEVFGFRGSAERAKRTGGHTHR